MTQGVAPSQVFYYFVILQNSAKNTVAAILSSSTELFFFAHIATVWSHCERRLFNPSHGLPSKISGLKSHILQILRQMRGLIFYVPEMTLAILSLFFFYVTASPLYTEYGGSSFRCLSVLLFYFPGHWL